METKFGQAVPAITLLLAVVGGVLLAISTELTQIDLNAAPQMLQGVVAFAKSVFASGVLSVGLIWLRNVWGYIGAYAKAKTQGNVALEYDVNKLYKTAAYYMGSIAVIFNVAPTPELKAIGSAIVFFIDISGSVLREFLDKKPS
jgi:hypothetical protein